MDSVRLCQHIVQQRESDAEDRRPQYRVVEVGRHYIFLVCTNIISRKVNQFEQKHDFKLYTQWTDNYVCDEVSQVNTLL